MHLLGVSEFMTPTRWLDIWAEHVGVKAHYEPIPLDAYTKDDPTGLMLEFGQCMAYIDEFGFTGGDPEVILPDEVGDENPLRQLLKRHSLTLTAARETGLLNPTYEDR